jgi:vacuolar-type H+-ATPase subunit I/STV1
MQEVPPLQNLFGAPSHHQASLSHSVLSPAQIPTPPPNDQLSSLWHHFSLNQQIQ